MKQATWYAPIAGMALLISAPYLWAEDGAKVKMRDAAETGYSRIETKTKSGKMALDETQMDGIVAGITLSSCDKNANPCVDSQKGVGKDGDPGKAGKDGTDGGAGKSAFSGAAVIGASGFIGHCFSSPCQQDPTTSASASANSSGGAGGNGGAGKNGTPPTFGPPLVKSTSGDSGKAGSKGTSVTGTIP
jgi:hypothetical protein